MPEITDDEIKEVLVYCEAFARSLRDIWPSSAAAQEKFRNRSRRDLPRFAKALQACRTEIDILENKIKGTYCAYCGLEFPMDDAAAASVTEHIHACEKHPIADYRGRIDTLTARVAELEKGLLSLYVHKDVHDLPVFSDNNDLLMVSTLNARIDALLPKQGNISKEDFDRHLNENAERVKAMPDYKRGTITGAPPKEGEE